VNDGVAVLVGGGILGTEPMKRTVPLRRWGGGEGRMIARLDSWIPRCLISVSSFSACFLTKVPVETAIGSKRPSFWDFFHERTVFGKASYVDVGRVYFSTEERSVKLRRADGGPVSWIWRRLIGQGMGCRKMCVYYTSCKIEV